MEYLTNPLFLALIAFILLLLLFDILQRLRRANVWEQIAADTGLQFSKHRMAGYRDQHLFKMQKSSSASAGGLRMGIICAFCSIFSAIWRMR